MAPSFPFDAFTFQTPPVLHFGWGTRDRLPQEAARRGRRPLVVVGGSFRRSGRLEEVLVGLRREGLDPTVHAAVPPEPGVENVQDCMDAARDAGADQVIGIGGGSVLDVAKAVALAGWGHPAAEYFAGRPVPDTGLPILLLPTTSGTGSEVTWVSVLVDRRNRRKASIRGPGMMPAAAIVDPELTVSCPPSVTAHSGMDAFVQAVESYTSRGANPMTAALAREAALLTATHLETAFREPENRPAREGMALGSMLAGIALNTSRLGLVHGLAHPLGAVTGAAHGLLCGMLLPAVIEFNAPVAADRYAELAALLGLTEPDRPAGEAPALLAAWTQRLLARLGFPADLHELGFDDKDLTYVAAETLPSGSTRANPRPVDQDIAAALLSGL